MARVAGVMSNVSGIPSRRRHRVGSCYSSNPWGSYLNVSPCSLVCLPFSWGSEDPRAQPTQHRQRIARYPGRYPLGQTDPWDQTKEVFDVPEVSVVSDPSLLVHTQSSENAEPEVHRAGEVDPNYGQSRLRV